MDIQTILIIVNMVLTVIISPLIEALKLFVKRISYAKCFSSEIKLSRENTPETMNQTDPQNNNQEENMKHIEEIIRRLSQNKTQSINI